MFLIPVVGGLLAGLLMKQLRGALIVTGILWIAAAGLLLALASSDNDVTTGTWVVIAIGLVGFALAWGAHTVRSGRRSS
jgi:hypothetical protein